jgi:signal transduction histidine kinase/ActR/RegA family two-component response regulator
MAHDTENLTYAIALVGLMIIVLAGTAVSMSVRAVWADRMREMEGELVTQRARASERMRIAQMATGAGTWDHDAASGRTEWTAEMLNLYDRTPAEGPPSRKEWLSLVHPDDISIATWTRPDGVGSASFETTFRIATRSGSWRWIASRGYADAHIGTGVVIGMDVDVTEQVAAREELEAVRVERAAEARVREAEEAVRQMQKMETVGQMTGGIAHDFNNMLTPIVGYLDMLQRRHGDDPRTARMLNMAMQSADRAKTLVSKLLSFSRRQQLEPKVVDASALVHDMREFVSKAIAGSGVEVSVEPSASPLCVRVDPNQLENVILNLAVNARDAMPDGGTVTMSVRRSGSDDVHVRPHGLAPGNYVVITVEDAGVGMDAETLRRAIEPFYTTKGTGKGTGLGLSMAHGMAGQSGGSLELRSRVGRGTTASVWLPEADASGLCVDEVESAEPMVKVPPCRVLLVDDDENVRRSISQMLSDLGHDVVEASSGAEALGRITPDDGFDMLVTDYLMPSMTGVELLKKVRATHSSLPVVVVSGYTAMADHDPIEGVARLAKPFTAARLAEAMGKVAARPRSGTVVDIGMGRSRR